MGRALAIVEFPLLVVFKRNGRGEGRVQLWSWTPPRHPIACSAAEGALGTKIKIKLNRFHFPLLFFLSGTAGTQTRTNMQRTLNTSARSTVRASRTSSVKVQASAMVSFCSLLSIPISCTDARFVPLDTSIDRRDCLINVNRREEVNGPKREIPL